MRPRIILPQINFKFITARFPLDFNCWLLWQKREYWNTHFNLLFRNVKNQNPHFPKQILPPLLKNQQPKKLSGQMVTLIFVPLSRMGIGEPDTVSSHICCRSLFHHRAACKLYILFCHVRPPSPPHPLSKSVSRNWHQNEVNWRVNIVKSSISLVTDVLTPSLTH